MKNLFKIIALLILSIGLFSGCAKWQNEIAAKGGIVGSYTGDYIVRNDSGGRIMDMWVLKNVIVQAEPSGSGWMFQDQVGDVIHLGGDVKVIRINSTGLLERYREYHAEFENKTYQELYGSEIGRAHD